MPARGAGSDDRDQRALRTALDRKELYLQTAPAFLVVLGRDQRVQLINAYGCRVLGYAEADLMGRNWYESVVSPLDRDRLQTAFAEIMAGARQFTEEVEGRLLTRTGEVRTIAWRRTLLRDDDGRIVGTLSAGEDVTERRRAERALAHLGTHDQLTGLPNRLLVENRLGAAVASGRARRESVAVLYIDLDDFGVVNDSLGHRAGDRLLCQVASRLRDALLPGETAGRHGGDEFLVLMESLPSELAADMAIAAADRVNAALSPTFEIDETVFEMNLTIGVSVCPGDAESPAELLAHADAAMYSAKREGRALRRYASGAGDSTDRLQLGRRLREALTEGRVLAHLQPIVELPSGQCTGFEALARWEDPHRGVIPPSVFIPYAERTGMIEKVGQRVLDMACSELAGLPPGTWMSVNVSARELSTPGLAASVAAALSRHEIRPASLLIEVTESAVVADPERAIATLATLRSLGVRLAIDDFGSGHSSLGRLRELPVDVLKIDSRFLRDVPGDPAAVSMLKAVIDFALTLQLTPVVEGVEDAVHRETLIELACPLAQGYFFGRPARAGAWRDAVGAQVRPTATG